MIRTARLVAMAFVSALLAASCSLVAPSDEELSSAWKGPVTDGACAPGTKRCAGTCVRNDDPKTGCGAQSCAPCMLDHASNTCANGECAVAQCAEHFASCDGFQATGCETDTRTSSDHCGACGHACKGETPLCSGGKCVPRCHAVKLTSPKAQLTFPTTGMAVGDGDFTLEAWVRVHGEFGDGRSGFVFLGAATTRRGMPALMASRDGVFCKCPVFDVDAGPSEGAGVVSLYADVQIGAGWHHIACSRREGQATLAVDGVARDQAASSGGIVATEPGAIGADGAFVALPAPPIVVGPIRFSRVARYANTFVPHSDWPVDDDAVLQYLTAKPFNGKTLVDEAGGDNDATVVADVVAADDDAPCLSGR